MPPTATERTTNQRLSPADWVRAALNLLAERGIAGVKVPALCERLGVTKGSFYWHFTDLDSLLTEVANVWADEGANLSSTLHDEADAGERLRLAMQQFVDPHNRALARAMRDWAQRDERARKAVRASDEATFAHVKAILVRRGLSDADAEVRAKILYFSGVGYAHVGNLGRRDTAEQQLLATWELLVDGS